MEERELSFGQKAAVFVWHGWWWTGAAYLFHAAGIAAMRESAKKMQAEAQPAN